MFCILLNPFQRILRWFKRICLVLKSPLTLTAGATEDLPMFILRCIFPYIENCACANLNSINVLRSNKCKKASQLTKAFAVTHLLRLKLF